MGRGNFSSQFGLRPFSKSLLFALLDSVHFKARHRKYFVLKAPLLTISTIVEVELTKRQMVVRFEKPFKNAIFYTNLSVDF